MSSTKFFLVVAVKVVLAMEFSQGNSKYRAEIDCLTMEKNESAAAEEAPAKEGKGKDQPRGAPDSAPYDPRDLGLPPVTINITDLKQDLEKVEIRVLDPDSS
ncbi:unnamed protein product [Urochloa humidicola]